MYKKKKVKGWSTEEMREKPSILCDRDTEQMCEWRGLSQNEGDRCWEKLAEKMEEEVLDKYKVKESKREPFRGGGAPLEWRRVRKNKNQRTRKWRDDCWAGNFSLFRIYNLQRLQSMHEDSTEEEEMKQQQGMNIMKDLTKKIRSEGRMDAKKPMVGY